MKVTAFSQTSVCTITLSLPGLTEVEALYTVSPQVTLQIHFIYQAIELWSTDCSNTVESFIFVGKKFRGISKTDIFRNHN